MSDPEIGPFEQTVLARLQVQEFLLTALIRGQMSHQTEEEITATIASLRREFATLALPAGTRTDAPTLDRIAERHRLAQDMLRLTLDMARPSRPDAGS